MEIETCRLKVLPRYCQTSVKIKSNCYESNKNWSKIKNATYFIEITNQKTEAYLSERGKAESTC